MLILIIFSICDCYESTFNEPIQSNENGVPLEHIVTAVNGVELLLSCSSGIKYLSTSSSSDIGNMSTRSSTQESDSKSEGYFQFILKILSSTPSPEI